MVAVKVSAFLPSEEEFKSLARLRPPTRAMTLIGPAGGIERLFLEADNSLVLELAIDYNSVAFKFECFGLRVKECVYPPAPTNIERRMPAHWTSLHCLFRFEWERNAIPGEVPSHWEQFIRRRGTRNAIDAVVTAICVSMVGLLFIEDGEPIAVVTNSDEDPATLRLCFDASSITGVTDECESVDVEKIKNWIDDLKRWQTTFERANSDSQA